MVDLQHKTLAMQRVEAALLSVMAGLALLQSAIGIFALISNIVTQKSKEIGIRLALGSGTREAMFHTGAPGINASLLGVALGLMLSMMALRLMRSVIYGVTIYDIPTLATVVGILVIVILIASVAPMIRILRIDLARTLREE